MTIDEFRRQKGWTCTELARQVGAPHGTVARRWCYEPGHKYRLIPNEKYMDRIINMSLGAVMPNDFYIRRK